MAEAAPLKSQSKSIWLHFGFEKNKSSKDLLLPKEFIFLQTPNNLKIGLNTFNKNSTNEQNNLKEKVKGRVLDVITS